MSYFKVKMHRIQFGLELRPPAGFNVPYFKGEMGKGRGKGGEGNG